MKTSTLIVFLREKQSAMQTPRPKHHKASLPSCNSFEWGCQTENNAPDYTTSITAVVGVRLKMRQNSKPRVKRKHKHERGSCCALAYSRALTPPAQLTVRFDVYNGSSVVLFFFRLTKTQAQKLPLRDDQNRPRPSLFVLQPASGNQRKRHRCQKKNRANASEAR